MFESSWCLRAWKNYFVAIYPFSSSETSHFPLRTLGNFIPLEELLSLAVTSWAGNSMVKSFCKLNYFIILLQILTAMESQIT